MATQEDAAAQKRIAEDMSDITKRTYRDSANMSAMTLINLCCLPGTFAAVGHLPSERTHIQSLIKDARHSSVPVSSISITTGHRALYPRGYGCIG